MLKEVKIMDNRTIEEVRENETKLINEINRLEKWLKNRKEECKCNNDVYRFTAYCSVLNKLKEIKNRR